MSYRIERLCNIIRDVVSDMVLHRLSDPRVSTLTSVTRVELTQDLQFADIYFSVMGTAGEASRTMRGLQSARGALQSGVARRLTTRTCPRLRLHLDHSIKNTLDTLSHISAAAAEWQNEDAAAAEDTTDEDAVSGDAPDEFPPAGAGRESEERTDA